VKQDTSARAGSPLHGGELAQAFVGAGKLDEDADDPVEFILQCRRRPIRSKQIGHHEIHCHAPSGSQLARLGYGDGGNFHCCHFQALLGQPHRIAAFAVGYGKGSVPILEKVGAPRQEMIGFDAEKIIVAGVTITAVPAGFMVHRVSPELVPPWCSP